jgi:hypothetical protein
MMSAKCLARARGEAGHTQPTSRATTFTWHTIAAVEARVATVSLSPRSTWPFRCNGPRPDPSVWADTRCPGYAAGLGYLINHAEGTFDTTGAFAGMVILAVFVLIIDGLVTVAERRLLVWRPPSAAG